MNILIVGGNGKHRAETKQMLEQAHFSVTTVAKSSSAVSLAGVNEYDMVIIDISSTDGGDLHMCKKLRSLEVMAPIIVIASSDNASMHVSALDSGADDFLLKPVQEAELLAHVRALLRRQRTYTDNVIEMNDVQLDATKYVVRRSGREVSLTSKEYKLLNFMMRRPNILCTKSMFEEHVWGCFRLRNSNVVEVTISRLRKKLRVPGKRDPITTRRGVGYILQDE